MLRMKYAGPPKIGCALRPGVGGVDAAVPHHADVVDAAVGLDEVVAGHVDVVVVDVDRDGPLVALRSGTPCVQTLMPSWKKATALWAITCPEP